MGRYRYETTEIKNTKLSELTREELLDLYPRLSLVLRYAVPGIHWNMGYVILSVVLKADLDRALYWKKSRKAKSFYNLPAYKLRRACRIILRILKEPDMDVRYEKWQSIESLYYRLPRVWANTSK